MNFESYTEDEIKRWLWLRAVEWAALPAFISQPVAPILFIFYPWYFVVLTISAIGALWCFVRYSFVSVSFASIACIAVAWLKWPASIGSSIYLFFHHQPVPAVVALIWPIVGGLVGIPGKVGTIEVAFAKSIGFVSPDAEL